MKNKPNSKHRSAMCTINFKGDPYTAVPDFDELNERLNGKLSRAMGQLEEGGKTGKLHWQIFLEFTDPVPEKKLYGLGMHIDTKHSGKHRNAGRNYVRKPTPYINSRFDWPNNTDAFSYIKEQRKLDAQREVAYDKAVQGDKQAMINLLKINIKSCQLYINK